MLAEAVHLLKDLPAVSHRAYDWEAREVVKSLGLPAVWDQRAPRALLATVAIYNVLIVSARSEGCAVI